jgi:putative phosphoesterase
MTEGLARIGVISDTHGQLRAEAVRALAGSQLILHAGDVGRPEILDELRRIAPVIAVRGNVDYGAWSDSLPMRTEATLGGHRIHMLHILADLGRDPAAEGIAAVIYGHSHKPEIVRRGSVLYFNPGSAGPRRFSLPVTVGRLTLRDDALFPELIELDV